MEIAHIKEADMKAGWDQRLKAVKADKSAGGWKAGRTPSVHV
jgi:hypothetical protein